MGLASYWIGIIFAILAGQSHYFGLIIEKTVINKLAPEAKLMKNLVRTPRWLFAIFIRFGLGSILFLLAQIYIGPAIVPGLMASGLIILTIGSIKIIREKLRLIEILAILLMIIAISLMGLSELSIEIAGVNLLESQFIFRLGLSSFILTLLGIGFQLAQKKVKNYRGILLALLSGIMFSLSNYWVSPLINGITQIFSGVFSLGELLLFIISSTILIIVNIFGVTKMAEALRYGQAGNLVPIQNVPVQITPSILYFVVFLLMPPSILSVVYFAIAVMLIIICSFILGKRQAQIEEIG